jgi:hypothetical protein
MPQTLPRPPAALSALLGPTGGLSWHLTALRQRRHWRRSLERIAQWLAQWQPGTDELLVLGASAGWCLPLPFLQRHRAIHCVDIDPVAGALFRFRLGRALRQAGTSVTWERADCVLHLTPILQAHPRSAILFANILGQHGLRARPQARAQADLDGLASRLQGRRWASFHDRLSGPWRAPHPPEATHSSARALDSETLARELGCHGVWRDHLTGQVLPESTPRQYVPWPLRPGVLHWLELGHVG